MRFCECGHKEYDHILKKGACITCGCIAFEHDYYESKTFTEPALLDVLGMFAAAIIVIVLAIAFGAFFRGRL